MTVYWTISLRIRKKVKSVSPQHCCLLVFATRSKLGATVREARLTVTCLVIACGLGRLYHLARMYLAVCKREQIRANLTRQGEHCYDGYLSSGIKRPAMFGVAFEQTIIDNLSIRSIQQSSLPG